MLTVCDRRTARAVHPGQPAHHEVRVRAAGAGDADAVSRLWCEQGEYEARIGPLRLTPQIAAAITAKVSEHIAGDSRVLLAERPTYPGDPGDDAEVVGAVVAQSPPDSAWVAGHVSAAPVSYLAMASTTAHRRGCGVGSALVAELHARHDAAGVAVSTLHYSANNPLSVPFWSQRGYRPLVTHFGACVRR